MTGREVIPYLALHCYIFMPPGIHDSMITEFITDFQALRGNRSSPQIIGQGAKYFILHVVSIPAGRCNQPHRRSRSKTYSWSCWLQKRKWLCFDQNTALLDAVDSEQRPRTDFSQVLRRRRCGPTDFRFNCYFLMNSCRCGAPPSADSTQIHKHAQHITAD